MSQELQQRNCILSIDFAIQHVAVSVLCLLIVEGYNVCNLLVQQYSVDQAYVTIQVGVAQQNVAFSGYSSCNRCIRIGSSCSCGCSRYIRICCSSSRLSCCCRISPNP